MPCSQPHAGDDAGGRSAAAEDLGWPLGPLGLRVLRSVWQHGRVPVRTVHSDIVVEHPVAYTTVMTVMARMAEKGLLARELVGKTHYYTAVFSPEQFMAHVSARLLESLVAEFGELAIAQFAAQLDRVDPDRLHRLRQAAHGEPSP